MTTGLDRSLSLSSHTVLLGANTAIQFCDCFTQSSLRTRPNWTPTKSSLCHMVQVFFDKGENASKTAKNVNSVYAPMTKVCWLHQFCSGNCEFQDASCTPLNKLVV